jgi:Rod binding domain-containing protein
MSDESSSIARLQRPTGGHVTASAKSKPLTDQPEVAAQQFEALLVQQMLESMWSSVPQKGLLSGSNEEAMYRDMLNEALATSISEGKGLGIKEVILNDFNKVKKKS